MHRYLRSLAVLTLVTTLSQRGDGPAFPTFPDFRCDEAMAFCNLALERGLHAVKRYGRGAAFVDIDGDGWDDLFLADSDNRWDSENYGVSMFFLNLRNGNFRPLPATELGIHDQDLVSNWTGSFADYDNDGDPDVLLLNGGYSGTSTLALYENRMTDGLGFVSRTAESGIGVANLSPSSWWGASWADYDLDGRLDVVVTRTKGRPLLFHNDGPEGFSEVGLLKGINLHMLDGKNPVWLDYDGDGDPDLYVAGMFEHAFYRNEAGARFTNVTGVVFSEMLPYPPDWNLQRDPIVFVAAAEDFNQDGTDDLYLGRWYLPEVLLINDGTGRFESHTADWGLVTSMDDSPTSGLPFENTMGLGVGDLFDDGNPDVWIGTGNPPRSAPDLIFCNSDDDWFRRCTQEIIQGADRIWRTRSHATVFSDFDHDGDSDVAVNLGGHSGFDGEYKEHISQEWPALFVNQKGPAGNTATITLEGTVSNRDAVGARMTVRGSGVHHYVVRSMQAFQSQNSRNLVVQLGSQTTAEVEVRWPAGGTQTLTANAGDRLVVSELRPESD